MSLATTLCVFLSYGMLAGVVILLMAAQEDLKAGLTQAEMRLGKLQDELGHLEASGPPIRVDAESVAAIEARLRNVQNRLTTHLKLLTAAVNPLRDHAGRAELPANVPFEIHAPDLRSQLDTQGKPHAN